MLKDKIIDRAVAIMFQSYNTVLPEQAFCVAIGEAEVKFDTDLDYKYTSEIETQLMIRLDKVTMGVDNIGEIIGFDGKYPVVDWKIEGEKPMTVKVLNEERCTREKKALFIWDIENRKQLYVI
ncbi:hypothetical protein [Paenibacillus xylaniclasticus]|uniref:hypothetical protein n=1 Tax=Paenibacillus xylaniclasticus TaxID=588083 RepID=UPI000FDBD1A2|nr:MULTISPECIES: hypothetical protein [Paenibacillus]GFN32555.1 hypothetical protein PCURB6_28150 [Paenibacillus curdlanolyticus]